MTVGSWNYPNISFERDSFNTLRQVGVFDNFRSWSGGDSYPPAVKRETSVDRRIKKWSVLAASLAYASSKEATKLIRDYNLANGFTQIRPGAFMGQDHVGRKSLHADGLLSESLRIRNGLSGNSRPVKRKRFPSDNAYTMRRIYDQQGMMTVGIPPLFSYPNGIYTDTYGSGTLNHNPVSLLDANDELRLVNKLKEKLQGSDFNMSVFLGEGRQSLAMIGDTAIKLAHAGRLVLRGRPLDASRVLLSGTSRKAPSGTTFKKSSGSAASNWLELQYGWLPLLSDAKEGAETLAHQLNVPMRSTYRVMVQRKRTDVEVFANTVDSTTYKINRSHTRYLTARVSEFDDSVPALLGLKDPELVAWELLPFSFVADWFLPIGSWLEARAMSSRLTGKFIYGDKWRALSGSPVSAVYGDPKTARRDYLTYTRGTPVTALNVPMPRVKSLAQAASWQHCTNGLALLTQVFTGSKVWSK